MKKYLFIALFGTLALGQSASAMHGRQPQQMRVVDRNLYEAAVNDKNINEVRRLLQQGANPNAKNYKTSDTAAVRVKMLATKEKRINDTYHRIYFEMTGTNLPVRQRQIINIPGVPFNQRLDFDSDED